MFSWQDITLAATAVESSQFVGIGIECVLWIDPAALFDVPELAVVLRFYLIRCVLVDSSRAGMYN